MNARPTLEDAIEQVQGGNREVFSVVVESFHVQIRAYISAMIHDGFDADDLAQQTFIFAFQHIQEFESGTNFVGWLKAIAFNHVRDYRSYNRRTLSTKRKLRQQIEQQSANMLNVETVDPRLEMLELCISRLPISQREFLKAVCGRQATLDEAAQELNRSGAAVRKNLSRLYDALRICVEQNGQGVQNREVSQ